MSLTGHIDVFPLEEVLRLLARSYKSGCLRVDASDLHGRIFMNNGSLTYATVGTDEDMRRQLLAARVVSDEAIRAAEIGGRSLGETAGAESSLVGDFFREEVVESLYRIRKPGKGQFVFNVDVAPKYRSESKFDVEVCIAEADRRSAEWADIESVISGIDQTLRIVADAPHNEPVTLAPNTWKLVANFEGPSSVRAMADRLGTSRFRVAKDLAALVRSGLVEAPAPPAEPAVGYDPVQPVAVAAHGYSPAASVEGAYQEETYGHQYAPSEETAGQAEGEGLEAPQETPDYNKSWWSEAVESAEDAPTAGQPEDEDNSTGESFLDRVFSQLNENPEGQGGPSPVPQHGFLKRRRMSSVGLDE